jgi:hypothetical protein
MINFEPIHFINEPIEVVFLSPMLIEKKPTCPNKFIWRGVEYPNRYFDLFYDRSPNHVDNRKGQWFLYREIQPAPETNS